MEGTGSERETEIPRCEASFRETCVAIGRGGAKEEKDREQERIAAP